MNVDLSKMLFHVVHVCTLKEISHHNKFLQDDLLSILRKCITASRIGGGGGRFLFFKGTSLAGFFFEGKDFIP